MFNSSWTNYCMKFFISWNAWCSKCEKSDVSRARWLCIFFPPNVLLFFTAAAAKEESSSSFLQISVEKIIYKEEQWRRGNKNRRPDDIISSSPTCCHWVAALARRTPLLHTSIWTPVIALVSNSYDNYSIWRRRQNVKRHYNNIRSRYIHNIFCLCIHILWGRCQW